MICLAFQKFFLVERWLLRLRITLSFFSGCIPNSSSYFRWRSAVVRFCTLKVVRILVSDPEGFRTAASASRNIKYVCTLGKVSLNLLCNILLKEKKLLFQETFPSLPKPSFELLPIPLLTDKESTTFSHTDPKVPMKEKKMKHLTFPRTGVQKWFQYFLNVVTVKSKWSEQRAKAVHVPIQNDPS